MFQRHGYSQDKCPDCLQEVVALVLTPDGFPLAYEVLPGLTPRQIIGKFKTLKMVDVILPTTDGRTITLPRQPSLPLPFHSFPP